MAVRDGIHMEQASLIEIYDTNEKDGEIIGTELKFQNGKNSYSPPMLFDFNPNPHLNSDLTKSRY